MRALPIGTARWLAISMSIGLVMLVSFAVAGPHDALFYAILFSATLSVIVLRRLFPQGRLLSITFVNLIAVYASMFALFVDEVFTDVGSATLAIGFVLPIAMFVVGCVWRRAEIRAVVSNPELRSTQGLLRSLVWLLPVILVGLVVLLLSRVSHPFVDSAAGFLVAMILIGLIVLAVGRDVAIFLVDTGLLFEEFFGRISHLLVPALAFLALYAHLVVVFASLYTVLSQFGLAAHFRIGMETRPISFPEALHFSIVTLSTVGYGDIVPISNLARTLAAIEVVFGVMLLLFGVSEFLDYAKERRRSRRRHSDD